MLLRARSPQRSLFPTMTSKSPARPRRRSRERCLATLTDCWVELDPTGEVTGFTVVRYAEPCQAQESPYVLALIRLDGADTPIARVLKCGQIEQARIGMRVRAVFSDKVKNNIVQIACFEPTME